MSCVQQTIRVFSATDNPANVVFGYTDDLGVNQLYDFSSVTRFVLTLLDEASAVVAVADTGVTAGLITDQTEGELSFVLGQEDYPVGLYFGVLVIYNPLFPGGYLMDTGDGYTMMVDVR